MPKQSPLQRPIQFRAGELSEALRERADTPNDDDTSGAAAASQVARRDLERYYYLLRLALPSFTEGEAALLCDVGNGTYWEPFSMQLLWANVSDALAEGYAEKLHVDGPALVARLRKLKPAETFAVVDAIERFWKGPYRREAPWTDALREVGLVKEAP